jgi:transcriptional regulator GlxA family with amidase domain
MLTVDPRVEAALLHLREKCAEPVRIEEVAASLNLSPSRLRHLIKIHTGLSPSRYLKTLRIEMTRQLLESTLLSVKEIMGRVGYGDTSHFFKDFKSECGTSPRQYRFRRFDPKTAVNSRPHLSHLATPASK